MLWTKGILNGTVYRTALYDYWSKALKSTQSLAWWRNKPSLTEFILKYNHTTVQSVNCLSEDSGTKASMQKIQFQI